MYLTFAFQVLHACLNWDDFGAVFGGITLLIHFLFFCWLTEQPCTGSQSGSNWASTYKLQKIKFGDSTIPAIFPVKMFRLSGIEIGDRLGIISNSVILINFHNIPETQKTYSYTALSVNLCQIF